MNKKKLTLPKQRKEVLLDEGGIDTLSQLLADALEQAGVNRKDIIRLRLAVEEILGLWNSEKEKETVCSFQCGTRLGRMYLEITAPGRCIDPDEVATDMAGQMLCSNLLAQAGLSPVYSYQDGINRLDLYPSKPQKISPLFCRPFGTGGIQDWCCGGLLCAGTGVGGILRGSNAPFLGGHRCAGIGTIGHRRPASARRKFNLLHGAAGSVGNPGWGYRTGCGR